MVVASRKPSKKRGKPTPVAPASRNSASEFEHQFELLDAKQRKVVLGRLAGKYLRGMHAASATIGKIHFAEIGGMKTHLLSESEVDARPGLRELWEREKSMDSGIPIDEFEMDLEFKHFSD